MNVNIGQKIKDLRLASDLTQEELATRADLTKGFISQLENEKFQTSISLDSLSDLVDALGVTLSEFFTEEKEQHMVFTPSDRIAVETMGVDSFELLVPGSTNNIMDPSLVELKPGDSLPADDPHPGEKFGFVLNGAITLAYDKKKYTIKKNSCFYFSSDKKHQILNNHKKPAKFLWIVTPPQM